MISFYLFFLPFGLHSQEIVDMDFLISYERQFIIDNFGIPALNGVDLYKLLYTSTDLQGNNDTLSGLIAIPQTENLVHPIMIYCHGTVDNRNQVPSRLSNEAFIAAGFGSIGYISIAPDYLGLGDSDGFHPYVHADSEASASYDMLKAIRDHGNDIGLIYNDQNFIFGYSQGGHAAMALYRYIETESTDGYEVTAAAPSSGPYSVSGEMKDFTLGDEEYFFVAYLANVVLTFEEVYGNIIGEEGLSSVFREDYVDDIEKFKNEEIGLFDLNNALIDKLIQNHGKSIPKFLFQEDVLNEVLTDDDHPMNVALRDNDVYDWTPSAPTRLFYCMGDDQVVYTNSTLAETTMKNNGAVDVRASDVDPNQNHTGCFAGALTLTIFLFDSYKDITSSTNDPITLTSRIFPNPSSQYLILSAENQSTGHISIYNLLGQLLQYSEYIPGSRIDISNLPIGKYQLRWKNHQVDEMHSFIKSN